MQLAWETLALMKGPIFFDMNVEFEDVRFLRATGIYFLAYMHTFLQLLLFFTIDFTFSNICLFLSSYQFSFSPCFLK